MTTTLVSMKKTIELIHKNNLDCKVMVGGAVLTPEYAKEIHADFYSRMQRSLWILLRECLDRVHFFTF